MDNRVNYRAVFQKTGSAKYISHLDLNRCMQRAIRRADLPAWYTEGFHPHMYLMFALALSLGAESRCETMDFRLTQALPPEEIRDRLNAALPEGLQVLDVHTPVHQAMDIGSADYQVAFRTEDPAALSDTWKAFMAQEQILMQKKTKRGFKEIDIKPKIAVCDSIVDTEGGLLRMCIHLPAGNEGNLNISIVLDAFEEYAEQPFSVEFAVREKIFCVNGEEFL